MFIVGYMALYLIFILYLALAIATMLLATVTVSNGLFVAIFAITVLWVCTLWFGKHAAITGALGVGLCLLFFQSNALSFFQIVRDGMTVQVNKPPPGVDSLPDDGRYGYLLELVREALTDLCRENDLPDDCYMDELPEFDGTIEITLPGPGIFEGQTAYISPCPNEEQCVVVHVNGGFWFIKGLWTWTGLENGLAAFRNTVIAFCWFIACWTLGLMVPPFRTMREGICRMMLPAGLTDAVATIRDVLAAEEEDDEVAESASGVVVVAPDASETAGGSEGKDLAEDRGGGGGGATTTTENGRSSARGSVDAGKVEVAPSRSERAARKARLIVLATKFHGGNLAMMTGYEVRPFRAPFECSWPVLKELMIHVHDMMVKALVFEAINTDEKKAGKESGELESLKSELESSLSALDRCVAALASNEDRGEELRKLLSSPEEGPDAEAGGVEAAEDGAPSGDDDENDDDDRENEEYENEDGSGRSAERRWTVSRRLRDNAELVVRSTSAWLDAVHRPEQGFKAGLMTFGLLFLPSFLYVRQMALSLIMPFKPSTWKKIFRPPYEYLDKSLLCVKFTIGFTALVCMTVYWDDYRNFRIETDYVSDETYTATRYEDLSPNSPNLYSGWQLIAYIFTTQPTREATVKKGLLRALGACLGCLCSWVGLIFCSGFDYDGDGANLNPYGVVAWLWTFSVLSAFFVIGDGPMARMGMSYDHGWVAMYFNLTLSLTMLNVYAAGEQRDNIIVNRLVANLTGICMAMVIALIPPSLRGGDPRRARNVLSNERRCLALVLRVLLDAEPGNAKDADGEGATAAEKLKRLEESDFGVVMEQRNDAMYLVKNASRLEKFPRFFKVDPKLMTQIERLTMTGVVLARIITLAGYIAEREALLTLFTTEGTTYRAAVDRALAKLTSGHQCTNDEQKEAKTGAENPRSEEADVFVKMVIVTLDVFDSIETVLSEMS